MKILAQTATLGLIGKLPAPGTAGSLVAVISGAFIAVQFGIGALTLATALVAILGFPAAKAHERLTGKKDAGEVVIDEVAGQWLTLLAVPIAPTLSPLYLAYAAAAFLLFRLFDITKIGWIKTAENLPGAAGVMADDILAAIFAGVIIYAAAIILGHVT